MIDKPLVSIGIPAYNGERYIRKALDSLLAQDYENFELIISDNASTDTTPQICKEYAARDKRIRVYVQSRNIGALANFKTVLEMARGKYFMWAAVDDCWLPEFVSSMVRELETHPDAGVAMCAVERRYEDGSLRDIVRFDGKKNPHNRTYYGMMKGVTSQVKVKYNLYIYGLYMTEILRKATRNVPEVYGLDRLLICHLALATHFRYIDDILHIRMNHRLPSEVRMPNEKFNKMLKDERWPYLKILVSLGRMLLKSDIIPTKRKVCIPVALFRYAMFLTKPKHKIVTYIERHVSYKTFNYLKGMKRRLWTR